MWKKNMTAFHLANFTLMMDSASPSHVIPLNMVGGLYYMVLRIFIVYENISVLRSKSVRGVLRWNEPIQEKKCLVIIPITLKKETLQQWENV